jgi:outer membrane protein OmpA-like peptidoglycan-associated protein
MANTEEQAGRTGSGSGKELVALIVVIALIAGAGTLATYWVQTAGAPEGAQRDIATAAEAPPAPRLVVAAPTPAVLEVVHSDIYFDFKSARLRADAVRLLQEKAALMERTSAWGVLVQGYADRQGPAEYNKVLARQRAEAVKQFLVELGVPEASIKVVTLGQEGTLCDEPGAECQQLNRRVHLEIRQLARTAVAPVRPVTTHGDELTTAPKSNDQP